MLPTILRVTIGEFFFDCLYFPVWWYSFGASKAFRYATGSISSEFSTLNISLWIKNLFTPMYGQYDWQGRIISFFMRFAQIIGRSIFFCIWICIVCALFLIYLLLPVAAIYYLALIFFLF